jgi:predicted dehydrogenase
LSSGELRIAVLGSGYIGKTYVEGMKYNKRLKLVAISGGKRAPGLAEQYHVEYEQSYDKLLSRSDIDAVLIATPHTGHLSQTVQAAEHGKHVLVEKPMATSVRDCDTMIQACVKAGVYLEVIQTLRFRGVPKRAKKLIVDGEIGTVRMIRGSSLFPSYTDMGSSLTWTSDPKEGGAFLDMGVHNFDIIRHFSGSDVNRVFSKVLAFDPGKPQPFPTAMTQLEMKSGAIAHQWMSFEMPQPNIPDSMHRYIIVGDKGIIDADGYGKLMLGRGDKWETVWEQPYFDFINDPMNPARLEAFYTQVQTFVDDVLDHRPPTVPGSEGRAAVEVVEAARMSSDTGKSIDLPLTP